MMNSISFDMMKEAWVLKG